MAPQKQAKRNAVSAKKRAGHGNNRGRAAVSAAAVAPAAAGTRNGQATKTSGLDPTATAAGLATSDPSAPVTARMLDWIRTHPLAATTWVLSMIGLGLSIYLTITHYDTAVVIVCSDKGLVNCEKVTTSAQSMVFGIFPVAVLGLAFYFWMFLVNSPLGWRFNRLQLRWKWLGRASRLDIRWLRLGSVIVGMGFVLYLIYAELIQIGNICLFCTGVHIVTFLMFVLLVYDASSWTSTATRPR
jgi:uncharacterized membrane protein